MNLPRKWADEAQYESAPIKSHEPQAYLLWMTPDPLGAIAAMCRMYEGYPTYSLADISGREREHYWEQANRTHLKAPLESVKLHFFIEGVDRAFTHQMVRQRTAVFAQESLRFAVKQELVSETPLPPSLVEGSDAAAMWDETLGKISDTYNYLVNNGIPAEDARGLLPHATPTRLNYVTDLRALQDHAGNRLCTQAQFHWRLVFAKMVQAISEYGLHGLSTGDIATDWEPESWQYKLVSEGFRPVCYQQGSCPFDASFDRHCSIRPRVQSLGLLGIPSRDWGNPKEAGELAIDPAEWLADPNAARRQQ